LHTPSWNGPAAVAGRISEKYKSAYSGDKLAVWYYGARADRRERKQKTVRINDVRSFFGFNFRVFRYETPTRFHASAAIAARLRYPPTTLNNSYTTRWSYYARLTRSIFITYYYRTRVFSYFNYYAEEKNKPIRRRET